MRVTIVITEAAAAAATTAPPMFVSRYEEDYTKLNLQTKRMYQERKQQL
jgi:hypothetical protein